MWKECIAAQFLFQLNSTYDTMPLRIAVVGAGIAGASTTFSLQEQIRGIRDVDITVYEEGSYVGGRMKSTALYNIPQIRLDDGSRDYYNEDWCVRNAIRNLAYALQIPSAMTGRCNDLSKLSPQMN